MRLNPLIGGVLLLSLLCSCSTSEDGGRDRTHLSIVYNSLIPERDTINYEIYLMDSDGSKTINLTRDPAVDWACHGWKDKIYFISDRDTTGGIYFLYCLDLASQKTTQLHQHRMANSWLDSRYDGTELVICRQEGNFRSFVIIDSTGYEIREILRTNQYQISDPAFSPDGKWIVFRSTRSGIDELWIADELGSHQRQLTTYPPDLMDPGAAYYHAGPPRWIPGSNTISYISRRNGYNHIFSINADGSKNIQLTSGDCNQGWHSWTPDGKLLVYDGDDEENHVDLFSLQMDNQQRIKLTNTAYPERAPIIIEYDINTFELE